MKNKNTNIGNWLKEKRLKTGMDTHQLADMAHIGQSQVSRIETGKSSITLNAMVSLSWALKIGAAELSYETNTPERIVRNPEIRDVNLLTDKLFMYDIEAIYARHFNSQEEVLLKEIAPTLQSAYQEANKKNKIAYDAVQKQIRYAIAHGQSIPNPQKISSEFLWDYYLSNAALTLDDAGAYLAMSRKEANIILDKMSKKTGISQSIISRIEQGQTERLGMDEIAALDKVIGAKGKVFSMFWDALEFRLGMRRNRFYINGFGFSPFFWQSYPLADLFVKLARWTEAYTSLDWLSEFRQAGYYENLPELVPMDFQNENNPGALSERIFSRLQLSLSLLVEGDKDDVEALGGTFVLDPSVKKLWQIVEKAFTQEPIGQQALLLLRGSQTTDPDYQGMFRAILQEIIRKDDEFRQKMLDYLTIIPAGEGAPTWVPGTIELEDLT